MKIDKSKVFVADVYEVVHSTYPKFKPGQQPDVMFGGYDYDAKKLYENFVYVQFGQYYVPISKVKTALTYLAKSADYKIFKSISGAMPTEETLFAPQNYTRFIKNIKPLFNQPGTVSLQELLTYQKYSVDNQPLNGGMHCM